MVLAVDRNGLKFLLLQPFKLQVDGGENFPSGNIRVITCLHLLHSKLISTTRGLTVLTFTAVPRTETSLSGKSQKDVIMTIFLYTTGKLELWQAGIKK